MCIEWMYEVFLFIVCMESICHYMREAELDVVFVNMLVRQSQNV